MNEPSENSVLSTPTAEAAPPPPAPPESAGASKDPALDFDPAKIFGDIINLEVKGSPRSGDAKDLLKEAIKDELKPEKADAVGVVDGAKPAEDVKPAQEVKSAEAEKSPEAAPDVDATSEKISEFKVGEEVVKLSDEAKIVLKVDGKDEEVSVADLKRDFQGRKPWRELYSKLKQDTTAFENRVKTWEAEIRTRAEDEVGFIQEFVETAQKDPWEALVKAAIKQGKNPAEFLPQYLKQAMGTARHIAELDEAQIDALVRDKSLTYREKLLQSKEEKGKKVETAKAEDTQIVQHVEALKERHTLTNEDLERGYNFLAQCDQDPNHPFKFGKRTRLDIANATVQYLVNIDRPFVRIGSVLRGIDPELTKDMEFANYVKSVTLDTDPNFTDDEIKEVALGVLGSIKPATPPPVVQPDSSKAPSTPAPTKEAVGKAPQKEAGGAKDEPGDGLGDFNPMSMKDILKKFGR